MLVVVSACGGGSGGGDESTASVPAFSEQPANVHVNAGQSASLHARAQADGDLAYQWYRDGEAIEGATEATLVLAEVNRDDHGARFTVEAETEAGSVRSDVAVVSVDGAEVAPIVESAPAVDDSRGGRLSVRVSGTPPFAYRWQRDGVDIPGATDSELAPQVPDDEATYGVVVSNAAGTAVSREVALQASTAAMAGPVIRLQPKDVITVVGRQAFFSVFAFGSSKLTYQWLRNGKKIKGATFSSYTTGTLTLANDGDSYVVIVTDTKGEVRSNPAVLRVVVPPQPPAIKAEIKDVWTTAGKTATFSVSASGAAPLTYSWKRNGRPIAGATGRRYTTPVLTAADDLAKYSVVVSNPTNRTAYSSARVRITGLATTYPTKPIVLTVPFAVNGATDQIGRALARGLAKELRQDVTVTNLNESSGRRGVENMLRGASPDGTKLLLTNISAVTTSLPNSVTLFPLLQRVVPLGVVGEQPLVLMGSRAMPTTVARLRTHIRANPGKVKIGTLGASSISDLCASLFQQEIGGRVAKVETYRTTDAIMADVAAGKVDLHCASPVPGSANAPRRYGVTTTVRSTVPALASLRTLDSAGLDDFQVTQWYGFYTHPDTPTAIVMKLNAAMRKVQADPAFRKVLQSNNAQLVGGSRSTPVGHAAFVRSETSKWAAALGR